MKGFRSLLWRIIGLHVLTLAAASIAVPLAAYILLNETAESYENQTLYAHAQTLAAYLKPKPDGRRALALPDDLRTFYLHGFGGFTYSIVDQDGHVEYASPHGGAPVPRRDQLTDAPVYLNRRTGTAIYYDASIPERFGSRTVWIEVAQNLAHPDVIIDDIVADFVRRIAWFTIPIMLVLILIDALIVRRALRPVVRASELAGTIDSTNLALRLPQRDLPKEILPLVQAVNQALERIEQGFGVLRDFTADAAHELRTPLSVLRLRVDTLLAPDVAAPLRKDIEAMSHVVEQLLAVAELQVAVVDADEIADLHAVAADVVALLAPIALKQGKDIALSGSAVPVRVAGNAAMLVQAVRNLAENALTHTMAGTTVEIAVDPDGTIRVTDEGPGIAESMRPRIFERFWRRSSDGAGLGLAIVKRIVDAHGGTVDVENRAPRGAVFSIRLKPLEA